MSIIIHYNRRCIALDYSHESFSEVNWGDNLSVKTKGSGEGKNYRQVEQEAQMYLIRNAMLEKPNRKLKKIVGIKQKITYDKNKKGLELKITLKGIAIFK